MSDLVKVALMLSVAIVLATTITVSPLIYFSPYQSCMRSGRLYDGDEYAQREIWEKLIAAMRVAGRGV